MTSRKFLPVMAALTVAAFLSLAGPASGQIKYGFQGSFDGSDSPSGGFVLTTGVATDTSGGASGGDLYVGHTSPATFTGVVDKFDASGAYAGVHVDGSATPQGFFGFVSFATNRTSSIAVDGSTANAGDLYVADIGNGVIDRFNEDGSFDCQITAKSPSSRSAAEAAVECNGAAGSETDDGSIEPTGIAIDPVSGEVYVADAAHNAINVFSPSGEYLEQITDLHLTELKSLAFGSSGALYAVAGEGALKFEGGSFVSVVDKSGADVTAVAADTGNGEVYVLRFDSAEGRASISAYDADGNPLGSFGHAQSVPFAFGVAVGPSGKVYLGESVFGPGKVYVYSRIVVPNVTTGNVIGVDATAATLTGKVAPDTLNGGGDVTSCEFEYVEDATYEPSAANPYSAGQTVPCAEPTPYSSATEVSADVTGLTRGVLYHYRLVAASAEGASEGGDRVFALDAPSISDEISIARTTSATVKSQINPSSYETTCDVQYVDRASFETSGYAGAESTPCDEALSGFGNQTASATLTGLLIGTSYHYRFVASNQAGTTIGADNEFSTFGVESYSVETLNQDGTPYAQAGGHPFAMKVTIALTTTEPLRKELAQRRSVTANLKTAKVALPPGLIGDPTATPKCAAHEMRAEECAPDAQIGVATVFGARDTQANGALYNLESPKGVAAQIGGRFSTFGTARIDASVRTGSDYGVDADALSVTADEGVSRIEVTLWGVPADNSHNGLRQCRNSGLTGCPSGGPLRPFLTNPTSCLGSLASTLRIDAWQEPGNFVFAADEMPAITGCERLLFRPKITAHPVVRESESPTGLHVNLHVPQNQNPIGLAEAHVKDVTVNLPEGLAINPAAATGLEGCSAAQVDLHGPDAASCPDAAKVGTVEVDTPLLDHPLSGDVFVATPHDNPFDSLLAIYIAIDDPQSGVVVKLPGHVVADPDTGRLTTTFSDNPQLPFEDFDLDFFGGPRAALMTPPTCGTYETTTDLRPWSENGDAHPTSSFAIASGPNGSACAGSIGEQPNSPAFSAGTVTPLAGAYSPFVLHLKREDGSQRLSAVNTVLPEGLVGKLAGLAYCPEAAIGAAKAKSGRDEQASASCPSTSEVGGVNVGAGAGTQPYHVQGKAYLAGPYKGAPLSLAIVTPAVAGPFDLGTVVVRVALHVDPLTAQISAKSDPLPTILEGIPLDIRSVGLEIDRPDFSLNPTSCEATSVAGEAVSVLGQVAPLSSRFQVGGCAALGFKPRLSLRLFGGTGRGAHPKLRAVLKARKGDANIGRAVVSLPRSEFLDQGNIRTVCTRVQFAADACPEGSIYGYAVAESPLLDEPLRGPVYMRSSDNELPDLVAALRGQIEIDLAGRIDSVRGGIRTTFETVPDAPVSKFVLTMQGGKKGLLVNSRNICERTYRAVAMFNGHNGRSKDLHPALKNSHCR